MAGVLGNSVWNSFSFSAPCTEYVQVFKQVFLFRSVLRAVSGFTPSKLEPNILRSSCKSGEFARSYTSSVRIIDYLPVQRYSPNQRIVEFEKDIRNQ